MSQDWSSVCVLSCAALLLPPRLHEAWCPALLREKWGGPGASPDGESVPQPGASNSAPPFWQKSHRIASQPLLSGVNIGKGESELGEKQRITPGQIYCTV